MATIQFTISNIDLDEFSAKRTILKLSLGIILVFDLGKPETFQHLQERMPKIAENAGFIPFILMGTNKDAEEEFGIQIPSMDIDQFMFKYGISHYYRVSTKTGEGIRQTFEILSDEIIKETIRKLGPEEVKTKTSFSFAVAMIGDKTIRKDWISEFGTQRFGYMAPSAMGGAISHKTLDRDIHHLIPEAKMDKSAPPPAPGAAPTGGGMRSLREAQLDELKSLKALKKEEIDEIAEKEMREAELERDKGEMDAILGMRQEKKKADEVTLEKPKPLQPIDFKKEEEKLELSDELKSEIAAEVERLRGIMQKEPPIKKVEEKKAYIPPPPSGPPSGAPAPPPPPPLKSAVPKEEPSPSVKRKDVEEKEISPQAEIPKGKARKKEAIGHVARSRALSMDREKGKPITPTAEVTASAPPPESAREMIKKEFEVEEESISEAPEDFTWGGAEKALKEMEITTEKLLRKTTVFYRERMNPETLNKLAVVLSSEKIYEKLKIKIEEVARAATDKTLEIDKELPIVDVIPEFPGCVCVPSVQHINAEKEYDVASFLITPLQTGDIPDAKVKLYHKGRLIDTIPTPTKVVKTTAAKISAGVAIVVPLLSQFPIIYDPLSTFLSGIIPFYASLGELEGIVLILTGLFALISGIFYLFKRPKDAKPVESFPELDETLQKTR